MPLFKKKQVQTPTPAPPQAEEELFEEQHFDDRDLEIVDEPEPPKVEPKKVPKPAKMPEYDSDMQNRQSQKPAMPKQIEQPQLEPQIQYVDRLVEKPVAVSEAEMLNTIYNKMLAVEAELLEHRNALVELLERSK